MRTVNVEEISKNIKEMCIEANHFLSKDMDIAMKNAVSTEKSPLGKKILSQLQDNLKIAGEDMIPICQDTGMAVVFLEIGQDVHFEGGDLEDAVNEGIRRGYVDGYLSFYEEHSLTRGSSSKACAYVGVICNGKTYWGVGIDADIIKASIEALTVAVNKIDELKNANECKDERMVEIMNYIQANYLDVSLDDLAEKFFLSKPYLSKYIKEKSGMTFGDIVKKVRMKKARALLKSSSMTVENIALTVGYQNVENFNRLFKKAYNITPVQFRNQK